MHKKWAGNLAIGALLAALICLLSLQMSAQSAGENIYKAKCASCHSADGSGATPAGKATKARAFCSPEVKKENVAEMTEITTKGKNKMPGYEKTLSRAEIQGVIAYLRTLCK